MLKNVDESVLARPSILSCLGAVRIRIAHTMLSRRNRTRHTERRTPTPTNITFAGENICQIKYESVRISEKFMSRTIPNQRPLQDLTREHRGRRQLAQAILTIVHHYFENDLAPGLAAEGWREWHRGNCKIGAGRRGDVQGGHSLYASCNCPMRY
jgi:hypothetical protein